MRNSLLVIVVAALLPGSIAAAGFVAFVRDPEAVDWWVNIRKPNWAPNDIRMYSLVDLVSIAPLGLASYVVYKHGGGLDFADTRLAMALYGGNMVLAGLTIPLVKKRNLRCLFYNTCLLNLTAVGAAMLFFKIDNWAGKAMIPYALWTGFYALLCYAVKQENPDPTIVKARI